MQERRGDKRAPARAVVWPLGYISPARDALPTHSILLYPWGCLGLESWLLVVAVSNWTGISGIGKKYSLE